MLSLVGVLPFCTFLILVSPLLFTFVATFRFSSYAMLLQVFALPIMHEQLFLMPRTHTLT